MIYALTTYRWLADEGGMWASPEGALGALDLRPLPDQALAGKYGDRPYSLFALADDASLDDSAVLLGRGDAREVRADGKQRDAWESLLGYRPSGDTLAEWIADQLTLGSDPAGLDRCAPLLPGVDRRLKLHCGGDTIWSAKHTWGDAYTNRIAARLHADYRKIAAENPDLARQVLDYQCEQYQLKGDDWRQLVPAELRDDHPGPLKHATTYTESFNTANSDTLGPDQTWTELTGDWDVVSNLCECQAVSNNSAALRMDADLSSDNHYAQFSLTQLGNGSGASNDANGPAVRKDSTATLTFYTARAARNPSTGSSLLLQKCVGGTFTSLGSGGSITISLPDTVRVEANGSTIDGYYDGVLIDSQTDTAITGNLRTGARVFTTTTTKTRFDSFECADLAVAGGAGPIFRGRALGRGRILGGSALA